MQETKHSFPRTSGLFVYGLCDPRTNEIRYVGKVAGYLNSRLRGHIREARTTQRRNHRLNWVRSLLVLNLEPNIILLERCALASELPRVERSQIAHFRAHGDRLTNETDGGEGIPNPSEDTRRKLRARPQVGWPMKAREACRERLRALWQNPEYRQKMSAAMSVKRDPSKLHSKYRPGKNGRVRGMLKVELGEEGYMRWKQANAKRMVEIRMQLPRKSDDRKSERHANSV